MLAPTLSVPGLSAQRWRRSCACVVGGGSFLYSSPRKVLICAGTVLKPHRNFRDSGVQTPELSVPVAILRAVFVVLALIHALTNRLYIAWKPRGEFHITLHTMNEMTEMIAAAINTSLTIAATELLSCSLTVFLRIGYSFPWLDLSMRHP